MPDDRPFVAEVLNDDGTIYDRTWNWESAQNYALSQGRKIRVLRGDGGMSRDEIQALCDAERDRYRDCYGIAEEPTMIDTRKFIEGYVDCALWSSTDNSEPNGGEPLDYNYSACDLSADAAQSMAADCLDFLAANSDDLARYFEGLPDRNAGSAGHDFWLTRNRHGAGFWDRYYGEDAELIAALKSLTEASHAYGESDLYVGDDRWLYAN